MIKQHYWLPLIVALLLSGLLSFYSRHDAISALAGGIIAWLPNLLFACWLTGQRSSQTTKGRLAWPFVFSELIKIVLMISLLVLMLAKMKMSLLPLALGYLSVYMVQLIAPFILNCKR